VEPVIDDPGAVTVLVQHVPGETPDQASARWRNEQWPEHVRTVTVFEAVDGDGVVLYAQLDTDTPPAELSGWQHYRRHRSTRLTSEPSKFFALNTFDSPDDETTREWLDAVQAFERNFEVPEGIIESHAHTKVDGTGFLNYAGWTDQRHHDEFTAKGVMQRAFAEVPPPGPPGPINGGFRIHATFAH